MILGLFDSGGDAFTIGVDIGGTNIAACLVDEDGAIVEQAKVDSPATDTDAIAAAELRGPDGAPLPNDIGLGDATVLSTVAQKTTDDTLRQWRVLSVPSSILAVVDLSGSMKMALGDTTRIGLAVQASQLALDAFPAQARIGIWGFSKNRGDNGASYEEYATLDRLDAPAGAAGTHGDVVRSEATKLLDRVRGGTGVMDTTLAAYKYAQEKWDPAWFNSVVIFTDGASDDTSSLSLDSLKIVRST